MLARLGPRRTLALLGALTLVRAREASAQAPAVQSARPAAPATTPSPTDVDDRLEAAKQHFRRGVTLLNAGDTERALEAFLESRSLVPSRKNSTNAAICLERLGRFDEALELYEEILTRFANDLDEDDRRSLAPGMAALRNKIGYLELSSNVDGLVVIDGRARGRLPLSTALRVLPGEREVRVLKDGYRAFTQIITVEAAKTQALAAELEPLPQPAAAAAPEPAHVAPARPPPSFHPYVGVTLGPFLAPSLDAGAEANCPSLCAGSRAALGGFGALDAGIRHKSGVGGELSLGYVGFRQSFSRAVFESFIDQSVPTTTTFALAETLTAHGPFVALRASLKRPILWGLDYQGTLGGGVLIGSYGAEVEGQAFTDAELVPVGTGAGGRVTRASPFVTTSIGVARKVSVVSLRAALGFWFFPALGPELGGPTIGVVAPKCVPMTTAPGSVNCTPDSDALAKDRAHGRFWAFTPELGATYVF